MKEKLYSKLNKEHNFRKVAESPHIFLTAPDEIETYAKMMKSNYSDNCVHCYNTETFKSFCSRNPTN